MNAQQVQISMNMPFDFVNVRSLPSLKASINCKLRKGRIVYITGYTDDPEWRIIGTEPDNQIGYVKLKHNHYQLLTTCIVRCQPCISCHKYKREIRDYRYTLLCRDCQRYRKIMRKANRQISRPSYSSSYSTKKRRASPRKKHCSYCQELVLNPRQKCRELADGRSCEPSCY